MKIAHFSDWHFNATPSRFNKRLRRFNRMLEAAASGGADHVILTGDMVDRADAQDYEILLDTLSDAWFEGPDGVSIVPGNHDIHPLSGDDVWKGTLEAVVSRWTPSTGAPRAQRDLESHVKRTILGRQRVLEDYCFPFVKRLDDAEVLLVGLDTVHQSSHPRRSAMGRFPQVDARGLRKVLRPILAETRPVMILAMHHFPFPGLEFGLPDGWANLMPSWMPAEWGTIPGDFEDVDQERLDVFLDEIDFDFLFCGHKHGGKKVRKLGSTKVINSAPDWGFHLLDTKTGAITWEE